MEAQGHFQTENITLQNDFGGTLYEYIGKDTAIDLMKYVDEINLAYGRRGNKDVFYCGNGY